MGGPAGGGERAGPGVAFTGGEDRNWDTGLLKADSTVEVAERGRNVSLVVERVAESKGGGGNGKDTWDGKGEENV